MADGQLELFVVEPSAGVSPVLGRELSVAGPVRHDANDFGEVRLDVELVQDARRDEREDVGGRAGWRDRRSRRRATPCGRRRWGERRARSTALLSMRPSSRKRWSASRWRIM